MSKNKPNRRDFLKLAGATSVGLALSACGLNMTETPTATFLPPMYTLVPTDTLTPTITPEPTIIPSLTATLEPKKTPTPPTLSTPTLRTVGEKLGVVFGTTVDGAEEFKRPEYKKAAGIYFSSIFPSGSFMQNVIQRWGLGMARYFRNLANEYNSIFHIHPLFWHQDVDETLRNASNDDVIKFMKIRVRTLLSFVNKVDEKHKVTYINFINEPIWYWKGKTGWENSPYYRVFGNNLITETYLMVYRIAQELGLEAGKDFRLLYSDYNIFRPGGKASFVLKELARSKKNIAKQLKVTNDNVQLDIAMQYHLDAREHVPNNGYFRVPADDEMLSNLKQFAEIGRIHITEFDVAGAKNQDELSEILIRVTRTAVASKLVDSINYWYSLRVFETAYDKSVREGGKENFWHPNGFFNRNYQPTDIYNLLVNDLLHL